MRTEVRSVISRVFHVSSDSIGDDPSPDTIPAWDSLGHLQLIAGLESAFGLKFGIREIQTMDSAGKIEAVLRARGR